MHEPFPDSISFGLDDPKFLKIVVECLRVHWSACASRKDHQLYFPSSVLSYVLRPLFRGFSRVELVHEIPRALGTCAFDLMCVWTLECTGPCCSNQLRSSLASSFRRRLHCRGLFHPVLIRKRGCMLTCDFSLTCMLGKKMHVDMHFFACWRAILIWHKCWGKNAYWHAIFAFLTQHAKTCYMQKNCNM